MHKFQMTGKQFQDSILFQDDDNDWEESGYVLCKIGNVYALGHYSHCSCYGTIESLCGLGIGDYIKYEDECEPAFLWRGNWNELFMMAAEYRDPAMPARPADVSDYDYDHLKTVYDWVLENLADCGDGP